MKPPALEYCLESTCTWWPMPPELAEVALSARAITDYGVEAAAQEFLRLLAGQPVRAVSARGHRGLFRLAR